MKGLASDTEGVASRFEELGVAVDNSFGEVEKQYKQFDISVEASANRMKNAWQDAFSDAFNSQIMMDFYATLQGFAPVAGHVLEAFATLTNGIVKFLNIILNTKAGLTAFGLVLLTIGFTKMISGTNEAILSLIKFTTSLAVNGGSLITNETILLAYNAMLAKTSLATEGVTATTVSFTMVLKALGVALSKTMLAKGISSFGTLIATQFGIASAGALSFGTALAIGTAGIVVIVGAIVGLGVAISKLIKKQKQAKLEMTEFSERQKDMISDIEEHTAKVKDLADAYNSLSSKIEEYNKLERKKAEGTATESDLDRLQELANIIGNTDLNFIETFDRDGNTILKSQEEIIEILKENREKMIEELNQTVKSGDASLDEWAKQKNKIREQIEKVNKDILIGGRAETTKTKYGDYSYVTVSVEELKQEKDELENHYKELEQLEIEHRLNMKKLKAMTESERNTEIIEMRENLKSRVEELNLMAESSTKEMEKQIRLSEAGISDFIKKIRELVNKTDLSESELKDLYEIQDKLQKQYGELTKRQETLTNKTSLNASETAELARINKIIAEINPEIIEGMTDINKLQKNSGDLISLISNLDRESAQASVENKIASLKATKEATEGLKKEAIATLELAKANIQLRYHSTNLNERGIKAYKEDISVIEEAKKDLDDVSSKLENIGGNILELQKLKEKLPDFYADEAKRRDVFQTKSEKKAEKEKATIEDLAKAKLEEHDIEMEIAKRKIEIAKENVLGTLTLKDQIDAQKNYARVQEERIVLLKELYDAQIKMSKAMKAGTKEQLDMKTEASKTQEEIWKMRSAIEETSNSMYKLYKERAISIIEEQADLTDKARKKILKILEESIKKEKQILDDEFSEFKKSKEKLIKELDDTQTEKEDKRKQEKLLSERAKLEKRINALSLVDTLSARKRKSELEQELKEKDLEILEFNEQRALRITKDKIQSEIEEQEELTKKAKNEIDERWTDEKKNAEVTKALAKQTFETASGVITSIGDIYENFANTVGDSSRYAIGEVKKLIETMMALDSKKFANQISYESDFGVDGSELGKDTAKDVPVRAFLERYLGIDEYFGEESQKRITWDDKTKEIVVDGNKRLPTNQMEARDGRMYANLETLRRLMKGAGFMNGGVIDQDGLTVVHGAKQREYLFNTEQYKDLAKFIVDYDNDSNLGSLSKANKESNISIENFLKVEGNVDEKMIPELERVKDDAITRLGNMLNKAGSRTIVSRV